MRSNRLATLAALCALAVSALPTSPGATPAYAASERTIASDISDTSKPWLPPWHGPPKNSEALWSYELFFGGIPLGRSYAAFDLTPPNKFDLKVNIVLNKFISLFVDFRLWTHSVGTLPTNSIEIERTETRILTNDRRSHFTFTYRDNELVDHTAVLKIPNIKLPGKLQPDITDDDDLTPVPPESIAAARDPTILTLVPRDPRWEPYDLRQCARTFPIFAGRYRGNMIMEPVRVLTYDRPRDNTKVLECRGRLKSIGGYPAGKPYENDVKSGSAIKRRYPITVYVMHDAKYDLFLPVLVSNISKRGTGTMRMVKVD